MPRILKRFVGAEDGLEMVEWAIVMALLIGAAAGTFFSLGNQVEVEFSNLVTRIATGG